MIKTYTVIMTVIVDEQYIIDAGLGDPTLERPLEVIIDHIEYDAYNNPTGYQVQSAVIQERGKIVRGPSLAEESPHTTEQDACI